MDPGRRHWGCSGIRCEDIGNKISQDGESRLIHQYGTIPYHRKLLLGMPSFKHRLTTDSIFKPKKSQILQNNHATSGSARMGYVDEGISAMIALSYARSATCMLTCELLFGHRSSSGQPIILNISNPSHMYINSNFFIFWVK